MAGFSSVLIDYLAKLQAMEQRACKWQYLLLLVAAAQLHAALKPTAHDQQTNTRCNDFHNSMCH
jgi:hypothetical protein